MDWHRHHLVSPFVAAVNEDSRVYDHGIKFEFKVVWRRQLGSVEVPDGEDFSELLVVQKLNLLRGRIKRRGFRIKQRLKN
ncbi:hypothetical protein PR048_026966 [Dryococelus australis]|uniref:Uncharacterized protein n=1 Tax=Dryococelus australis TaxID=614101 RepID=A0ABQ9GMU3_9NEOP|nr:hypothetical protein PR048_026966 [Dryococelus australis]